MGYDVNKDDAMTKESDGYVRIEKYINWLGASHMHISDESSRNFDLRTITSGFQSVKPTYSVSAAENGNVELLADGYTARFTPKENFKGLASFMYTVKGNDKTEYSGRVEVLVEKGVAGESTVTEPSDTPDSSTTRIAEKFRLHENPESAKVFDMNGNYMGTSMRNLPQGRYIVRQKIQGRVVNFLHNKN
jgi:hypothetical protein